MNSLTHKPKSVMDIRANFNKKVKGKSKGKKKDIKEAYDIMQVSRDELNTELMVYYSTREGRQEIDNSPHLHLTTKEAVDLLMRDVDSWIAKELNLNAETAD